LVRDYVETEGDKIELEFLPPYAPELNPVGYLRARWKQHEMPKTSPNSAPSRAPSSNAPSVAKRSLQPSGSKPNCPSDVTLFVKDQ
jgi:hypothetical protein